MHGRYFSMIYYTKVIDWTFLAPKTSKCICIFGWVSPESLKPLLQSEHSPKNEISLSPPKFRGVGRKDAMVNKR